MAFLHLAPGSALMPAADDTLLLVAADERFAALSTVDATATREVLFGRAPVPAEGELAELVSAVLDWGAGTLRDDPATKPPRGPGLAAVLAASRDIWTRLPDLLTTPGLELVVHELLDDAACLARDAEPRPWLPVQRELGRLVAGPVLGSPAPPYPALSWADVRYRRLAASTTPRELLLLWRAWQQPTADDVDVRPDPSVLATAARTLAGWVGERAGALHRHQLVVPLDGSTPGLHPVLPVPRGLLGAVA